MQKCDGAKTLTTLFLLYYYRQLHHWLRGEQSQSYFDKYDKNEFIKYILISMQQI